MDERKVAIVTGASAGIGEATAIALARRGYAVVVSARRQDKLERVAAACDAEGGLGVVHVADVSDESQVDALVASTVERFGRVDVMVNNAGYGLKARVHETTDEQMRAIFDVNFHGVFYGCKAVAPVMMRQRSGHIFNLSSVIGNRGSPFNGGILRDQVRDRRPDRQPSRRDAPVQGPRHLRVPGPDADGLLQLDGRRHEADPARRSSSSAA